MNLDHLSFPDIGWGYMPPTDDVFRAFEWAQKLFKPKRVLEIGFHLGHSTTYQLEIYKDLERLISVSPYEDRNGKPSDRINPAARWTVAMKLAKMYRGKWRWIPGKAHQMIDEISIYDYDFALIDGGHTYPAASHDMTMCIDLGIKAMLIDNFELVPVRDAFADHHELKLIKKFYYEQTFKGRRKMNQLALVKVDSPQLNLL